MVATEAGRLPQGAQGLAALVREAMVYVFRAKRPDRVKLVYFDTGVCLLAKRLKHGKFSWPALPMVSCNLWCRATDGGTVAGTPGRPRLAAGARNAGDA
ncbi:IS66 family insertion sequence element accessory protein TnpB [Mesorhizobium sp. M0139]|uniref:IS66 family insertion sequence element accessory protein TnpB n=1 Tax=Mesorhizobium sp. M0139 TaxID=2956892 RepID=UPI00333647B8